MPRYDERDYRRATPILARDYRYRFVAATPLRFSCGSLVSVCLSVCLSDRQMMLQGACWRGRAEEPAAEWERAEQWRGDRVGDYADLSEGPVGKGGDGRRAAAALARPETQMVPHYVPVTDHDDWLQPSWPADDLPAVSVLQRWEAVHHT
eukprot:COSAG02_NODE_140_length_34374_cov_913.416443_7_plen_150_part_00